MCRLRGYNGHNIFIFLEALLELQTVDLISIDENYGLISLPISNPSNVHLLVFLDDTFWKKSNLF